MQNLVEPSSVWSQVPDFTGQVVIRLLWLSGMDRSPSGPIALSAPIQLLILQWTWFGGQEDKHFLFEPMSRSVWLCARDRRELHHFYGRHPEEPLLKPLQGNSFLLDSHLEAQLIDKNISKKSECLLVPMRPFNEYCTTHFGHFVVELLPLLMVAKKLGLKVLLSRDLPSWASELLALTGLEDLEDWICPFREIAHSGGSLPRADLSGAEVSARLVKLKPSLAASLLNGLSQCRADSNTADLCCSSVAVLSRSHRARYQRWMNEQELLQRNDCYAYVPLIPEQLGVMGLRDRMSQIRVKAVVVAVGSAAYQLFLNPDMWQPVVLLCGTVNPEVPGRWLSTFWPFRQRFWLLFHQGQRNGDWNAPFTHSPDHIEKALSLALSGQPCHQLINFGQQVSLLPPGVTMGHEPPFGVDFG